MAYALRHTGPFSLIVRRTATGKDETPVRQRYSDPDGGPSVLVPGKEASAAGAMDLILLQTFGKEARITPSVRAKKWAEEAKRKGRMLPPKRPSLEEVAPTPPTPTEARGKLPPEYKPAGKRRVSEMFRIQKAPEPKPAPKPPKELPFVKGVAESVKKRRVAEHKAEQEKVKKFRVTQQAKKMPSKEEMEARLKSQIREGVEGRGPIKSQAVKRMQKEFTRAERQAKAIGLRSGKIEYTEPSEAGKKAFSKGIRGKKRAEERRKVEARGGILSAKEQAEIDKLERRRKKAKELLKTSSAGLEWLADFVKEAAPPINPRVLAAREAKRKAARELGKKRQAQARPKPTAPPAKPFVEGLKGRAREAREQLPDVGAAARKVKEIGGKALGVAGRVGEVAGKAITAPVEAGLGVVERGAEKAVGLGEAIGRGVKARAPGAAKWVGEKARKLVKEDYDPALAGKLGLQRKLEFAPRGVSKRLQKREMTIDPETGRRITKEEMGKVPPRFRYAGERERAPGGRVKGEILPAYAGVPSLGIGRAIARKVGDVIPAKFVSEAERRGARPTIGQAGKWGLGLGLRGVTALPRAGIATAKAAGRGVERLYGGARGLVAGLRGKEVGPPTWAQRYQQLHPEQLKKLPKEMREKATWVGGKPYVATTIGEAKKLKKDLDIKPGSEEARKFDKLFRKELPSTWEERAGAAIPPEKRKEILAAREELKGLTSERRAQIQKENPGYLKALEARAAEGPGAKPVLQKYEKVAPMSVDMIRADLQKKQPDLSPAELTSKAQSIHDRQVRTFEKPETEKGARERIRQRTLARRAGEAAPGERLVEPIVPGTEAERAAEKARKAAEKKVGRERRQMRKGIEVPEGAPTPAPGAPEVEGVARPGARAAGPAVEPTRAPVPGAAPAGTAREQARAERYAGRGMMDPATMQMMAAGGAARTPFEHVMFRGGDLPNEVRVPLINAMQASQGKAPKEVEFAMKKALGQMPENYRGHVQGLFDEWGQMRRAAPGIDIISTGPKAMAQTVGVPRAWAQEVLATSPEYKQYFTPDPAAPTQMNIDPAAFQTITKKLKGRISELPPGDIRAVAPPVEPGKPMPTLAGFGEAPVTAAVPRVGAQAPPPGQEQPGGGTTTVPSGQQVNTNVLADLFSGAYQGTPQYQQFLESQGVKQPGGLASALMGAGSFMLPYMMMERIAPGALGGMGGFMGAQVMAPGVQNFMQSLFGYTGQPQMSALNRMYMQRMLGGRGEQAAPAGGPTPGLMPGTTAGARTTPAGAGMPV